MKQTTKTLVAFAITILVYVFGKTSVFFANAQLLAFPLQIAFIASLAFFIVSLAKLIIGGRSASIQSKLGVNVPAEASALASPENIRKKYNRIILVLLALQYSVLGVYGTVFIANGFSMYGDAGVLLLIYALTLFIPTVIAFLYFIYLLFKDKMANKQYLTKMDRINFYLFWTQFIFFMLLSKYL